MGELSQILYFKLQDVQKSLEDALCYKKSVESWMRKRSAEEVDGLLNDCIIKETIETLENLVKELG